MTAEPGPRQRSGYEAIVCGAGAAGLSSAALLQKAGIDVIVLEKTAQVGSSWRSRYDSLRFNSLGWMSTQPGYHLGRRPRHFPSRDEFIDYLERYARHHRVPVRFDTEIARLDRGNDGWRVESSAGTLAARFVVVATGYSRVRKLPEWPGRDDFAGELIHSAEYRNPDPFRGRNVVVVGAADTGTDIATDLVRGGAGRVRVSMRTPPNILARCRFGFPLNLPAVAIEKLPAAAGDRITALNQRLTFGDLAPYGLPRAPKGVVSTLRERRVGPAIDDGFVEAVKDGQIEIVAAVERFEDGLIVLADGSRTEADAVIAATGYDRGLEPLVGHLPVLDDRGEPVVGGGRTHPAAPGLYFVGYRVPLSGMLRGIRIDAKRMARAVARQRRDHRPLDSQEAADDTGS